MIELEARGEVTILRMVAGKGNALNLDFLTALSGAMAQLERGAAKAVVVTGQGSCFSAGVDLRSMVDGGPAYVRQFLPLLARTFEQFATFSKPLVAAVNGHSIAGGLILTLACDQRLLARGTAQIGLTEIRVGVEFPAWPLEIARFATPPEHFSTLICTGRTWPPEEALARGLVDELVDPARLIERACEVAEELRAIPASAFSLTKAAIRRPLIEAARQRAAERDAATIEQWCRPETLRDMAAFAAKAIGRGRRAE
jgi:enoyl-CoA hydratase